MTGSMEESSQGTARWLRASEDIRDSQRVDRTEMAKQLAER